MRIRHTRRAVAQLDAIYGYIEARRPAAASEVKARIRSSVDRLKQFPRSCSETDMPGIRMLPVASCPHLVFYTVDEVAREVQILRIRHGAQDPAHHLD